MQPQLSHPLARSRHFAEAGVGRAESGKGLKIVVGCVKIPGFVMLTLSVWE